jgi:2-hydroxycyclohexanecarboxyl-CoA dehydrogenase
VATNFLGKVRCCHVVVPGMVERRWGRVVNIASDAGRVGSSGEVVYSGTKGGVIAFSKALAREAATSRVTVNVVCPGPPTPRCSTRWRRPARNSTTGWHERYR